MQARIPVRVIPAKPTIAPMYLLSPDMLRKTAGYARVSTDSEEQATSYDAQVDYYTNYIQNHDNWHFAGVYADEGISGTSMKKRDAFNRMIQDAMDGKIDLIVTKSVSRFARNTVDTLTTVRSLKEKGVEVYFENQNLWTLDPKAELLLTIMASLAQEESRNISENVTWGHRKRFADGKFHMPYKRFLGYEKGPDDRPQIVEAEAAIVRDIYKWFLEGKPKHWIAKHLMELGIPSPGGKEKWRPNTVESILTNEKYKGDALLQKTFTADYLTKKIKKNEGEVPQYYAPDSHPAIIPKDVFDIVQQEIQDRAASGRQTCATYCFSGKIICGECGTAYGSKTRNTDEEGPNVLWRCNQRSKKASLCQAPSMAPEIIERAFVMAVNSLLSSKREIIAEYRTILRTVTDTSAVDAEIDRLSAERDAYELLIRQEIQQTAQNADSPSRNEENMAKYIAARDGANDLEQRRTERNAKRQRIALFIRELEQRDGLVGCFDEQMWYALADHVTVISRTKLAFAFKSGQVVEVDI